MDLSPFEKTSLNLATLCGAIPLTNFLANDYDDTVELDYHIEFHHPASTSLQPHPERGTHFGEGEIDDADVVERLLRASEEPSSPIADSDYPMAIEGPSDPLNTLPSAGAPMDVDRDVESETSSDDDDEMTGRVSAARGTGADPRRARTRDPPVGGPAPSVPAELGPVPIAGHRISSQPAPALWTPGDDAPAAGTRRKEEREEALDKLHRACTRLSGTAEALRFDFLEDDPTRIQCILTITIPTPNGVSKRSYASLPTFYRKADAKGEAACIAVERGALDFLKSASSTAAKREHHFELLARAMEDPLADAAALGEIEAGKNAMGYIEELCKEWRVGVRPDYVTYRQKKGSGEIGCAMRLALTPHAVRTFSVPPEYSTIQTAQGACAIRALEEGVAEYIMYGNGQKSRPQRPDLDISMDSSHSGDLSMPAPDEPSQIPSYLGLYKQMSLQEFFESLPRPFAEPVEEEGKTAGEILWSNMLNMIIQGAKLPSCKASFYFVDTERRPALTGCILRVSISDPFTLSVLDGKKEVTKTYMVNPHFVKTNDAKNAGCILAVTQDLRGFLTELSSKYEEKVKTTRDFDKMIFDATTKVIAKFKGYKTTFDFTGEKGSGTSGGFGCTMAISCLGGNDEDPRRVWSHTTPTMHASKGAAKVAAVIAAAQEGAVETLRFPEGTHPPAGYRSFWDVTSAGGAYDLGSLQPKANESQSEPNRQLEKKLKRKRDAEKKKAAKRSESNGSMVLPTTPTKTIRGSDTEPDTGSESGEISDSDNMYIVPPQASSPRTLRVPGTPRGTRQRTRSWEYAEQQHSPVQTSQPHPTAAAQPAYASHSHPPYPLPTQPPHTPIYGASSAPTAPQHHPNSYMDPPPLPQSHYPPPNHPSYPQPHHPAYSYPYPPGPPPTSYHAPHHTAYPPYHTVNHPPPPPALPPHYPPHYPAPSHSPYDAMHARTTPAAYSSEPLLQESPDDRVFRATAPPPQVEGAHMKGQDRHTRTGKSAKRVTYNSKARRGRP